MIAQEILPSQVPYTLLDYGVTVMVLICLGIVLWFVFKTQAKILADHAEVMRGFVEQMRVMKEELMTLVVDTRHLHESITLQQRSAEWDRSMQEGRQQESIARHLAEEEERKAQAAYRARASAFIDEERQERLLAEEKEREAQQIERLAQQEFRESSR